MLPERRSLGRDALAGVPGAIGSVPDGMASAVLVVDTEVKVMLIGVRPAGPSMKTPFAVLPPEVVMSPEVTVSVPVLF